MEKYDIEPFRDTSEESGHLRLYSELDYTRVHGPGNRYSLWFQGCLKRCPGCSNIQMLDIEEAQNYSVSIVDMIQRILRAKQSVYQVNGITLQGGEPMIQAKNLGVFLAQLKNTDPDIDVLLFTGYKKETLMSLQNSDVIAVLSHVDTLIDGVFEKDQRDNKLIRGSKNQRLYHISPRLKDQEFLRGGRSITFGPTTGTKVSTGIKIKEQI